MNIGEILRAQAHTRPHAVALLDARGGRARPLTFRALEQQVLQTAAWLEQAGLQKGMGVLVAVPLSAELYVGLLAMFRLGVAALFLDPSAPRAHIEQCCARWAPDAFLGIPRAHWLRVVSAAVRRIPRQFVVGGWTPGARRWPEDAGGAHAATTPAPLSDDDPALVTFTSGSTGVPKVAVRTHGFLVAQHRVLAPSIALELGEIDLATLPVFTLANLASGVTTVIPDVDLRRPGAIDGARVCEQIARFNIGRITASPAFFERMIAHARAAGITLPSLRKIHTGGAPVFPRLLDALREVAPHARIVAVYGSTEAEPIAHLAAEEIGAAERDAMLAGRGLLAGTVDAAVRLRILRDRWGTPRGRLTGEELQRDTLPPGSPGEIVVTGDAVLKGYLNGIGDEETKFSVGPETWHRTGDAGLLDAQGRLWLLGRCGAKIADHAGELYPLAVECVAMTFPEIARVALVGHAGKRLLVVESPVPADAFASRLRAATAWAKIDEVRVVAALPVDRRHNAKIDYPALRRMLGGDPA
jgi:acyl-CoA synthetase (AMP-forming)/AMP-acid ligase II